MRRYTEIKVGPHSPIAAQFALFAVGVNRSPQHHAIIILSRST